MTANNTPVVGFIGLGDQGAPMAQAVSAAGYPLHVWARQPQSLAALDGYAHTAHATLAELARVCDIVALCLPKDADNTNIAVEGGLLADMSRGAVLVNHGTGMPQAARELAELAENYGVEFVDAPVSGGRTVALACQLTTIVGGNPDVVSRVEPIFNSFSKLVIHVGPTGSGQYAKLFNNALMMMNHNNIHDILRIAQALELPINPLLDVLRSGSATSFALQAIGPSITTDNVEHLKQLELIDAHLFAESIESIGAQALPVIQRAFAGARQLDHLTAVATV
jgi:3-hydroxyisobutyrate dehydrogenase-like beta-hydroxyacid dehydrogenase